MPLEEFEEKRIVGTLDQCIEKICEYVNAGVNYLILYFPDASEIKPLRLFSKYVMPHFITK